MSPPAPRPVHAVIGNDMAVLKQAAGAGLTEVLQAASNMENYAEEAKATLQQEIETTASRLARIQETWMKATARLNEARACPHAITSIVFTAQLHTAALPFCCVLACFVAAIVK